MFRVIQNDRMFRKQKILADNLTLEEASWIQMINYGFSKDQWIQFAIESKPRETWK